MVASRRKFIETGLSAALAGSLGGLVLLGACEKHEKKDEDKDEDKEVSPPEDLMQEHGLLNRILLIYDTCRLQLVNKTSFAKDALLSAATILRTFVEDYHEKQEEDYLFPRFRKANQQTDLVAVLLQQHKAGRAITDQLTQLCKTGNLTDAENQKIAGLLSDFNRMYRPHEAREDTILFPAFRTLVSKHEYAALGEEFESNEQKKFGKDGFETMVAKVADIEKTLGIYDLAQFTPQL